MEYNPEGNVDWQVLTNIAPKAIAQDNDANHTFKSKQWAVYSGNRDYVKDQMQVVTCINPC